MSKPIGLFRLQEAFAGWTDSRFAGVRPALRYRAKTAAAQQRFFCINFG